MLKLSEDITVNAYARPVCMPNKTDNYEDMTCVITGWGAAYTGTDSWDHFMICV